MSSGGRPTGAEGGERASAVLTAVLEPRPGGRLVRATRLAGAVIAQLALQLLPSPTLHDVVVRRRSDGKELVRVPGGDPFQVGDMLAYVNARLEALDEQAFLAEWEPRLP